MSYGSETALGGSRPALGLASAANQACAAGQLSTSSEIEQVTQRIHGLVHGFEGIASQLCAHADRLHGSRPEEAAAGGPVPCRMGQMGALHDALDRLSDVQAYVSEQAGRNSNIA